MCALEEVKKYINQCYKANKGSYTVERSEGNSDDVFSDGYDCGVATTLYNIGKMLEMDIEELEEPDYDY